MFLGRAPAIGEPLWTDEDRALALAWQDYKADLCSGCGHQLSVSTRPENQFSYAGEMVRCHACATQERTAKKFVDSGGDQAGILFRMTTTPE